MSPSLRHVVTSVIFTLVALSAVGGLAGPLTANSVPRQVLRHLHAAPRTIDVLALGNSLVAAGIDASVLESTAERTPRSAVNAAIGATGVIEHLGIARTAMQEHLVRTLVYGYFDFQMYDDLPKQNADLLGNRAMLYDMDPSLTLEFAPFVWTERMAFLAFRTSPLLSNRSTLWAKVERARRWMNQIGVPSDDVNRFGRRQDFSLLEARSVEQFNSVSARALGSGEVLSAPIRALLQETTTRGIKVFVVAMPMHPDHLTRFYTLPAWDAFDSATQAALEAVGATYIDASKWMADRSLFDDALHLTANGARLFTHRLRPHIVN